MKTRVKWLNIVLCCLMLALCVPQTVWATENEEEAPAPTPTPYEIETNWIEGWAWGPETQARTACLIDGNTGAVLYNKGMTEKMHPASTTKIMTTLLVLENAELDEVFTFTETGVAMAYAGSSNLITQVGETFTVEDALYALMLKSANDFAAQIAEYVGGTEENFVQMMNDKAAELGCVNTHFANPHGMTDENHWSCAYDLCLIMQELSKNEDFLRIAKTTKYVIPETHLTAQRTIETHNGLIMEGDSYYEWALAGKTGYTDAAWCTYVSVAEKDGMRLIEATMKAPQNAVSFADAKTLYEYGFGSFKNLVLEEPNEVYHGGMATVPNSVTEDQIVVETGESFETILGTMVNKTYSFNGHQVGYVAAAMDYIEQVEAEEEAKIAAEIQAEQDRIAQEEAEKQAQAQKIKDTFKLILKIMVILVGAGILMIIILLIRKALWLRKRRIQRRKRREAELRKRRREQERREYEARQSRREDY